jgi:multidrug efflux system outer membrane protein
MTATKPLDRLECGDLSPLCRERARGALRADTQVRAAAALVLSLMLLSGCALQPKYDRPTVQLPPAYKEPLPEGWKEAHPRDEVAKGDWWLIYEDPVLNTLEAQATSSNQTLVAAVARLDEARAQVRLAHSRLLPTVSLDINTQNGRLPGNRPIQPGSLDLSYNYSQFTLPLDLNYEIDIWGRLRSGLAAARFDAQTSAALYQFVLLSVKSDVAASFFMIRGIDTDRRVIKQNIEVEQKLLDLAKNRHNGGLVSGLDVSQAETELASTNADYIGEGRLRQEVEHSLAVLCGQPASSFTIPEEPRERVPPRIPEGLPADLLERRPDVAAAERQMAANNARIGVARSAFFPVLGLTSSGGFLSSALTTLLNPNSGTVFFSPLLSIPIFQGGRPQANLEYARKVYAESVANYRQQLLVAFQDVENGLSDMRILQDQGAAVDKVLDAARRTVTISQARYKQGLANYLEVLDAQRVVLANERLAAQILGYRMVASVQLIKALGGGWADRPPLDQVAAGAPGTTGSTAATAPARPNP